MLEKFTAPIGTALDRFIAQKQEQFPFATGELSQLLRDIALAAKIINREINRAGLSGIEGSVGEENVQGENQQKLDVVADVRFIRALIKGEQTCGIISEEDENLIDTKNPKAKYVVAIDPLDGSSNINVNVSVGTIFSIYRRRTSLNTPPTLEDMLQPGRDQIAAGYVLYGSSTMLVYSTGYGVNGFTYEPSLGEFFLSHPNIKMKENGEIYSFNDGLYYQTSEGIRNFIEHCRKNQYSGRYIGSLVSDFHRNMLKGGMYLYPATKKHTQGKLRLMYECNALAFLAEQAGGMAFSDKERILDIMPESLHQRVPLFIGSKNMVKQCLQLLNEEGQEKAAKTKKTEDRQVTE
ncbi:class 1 fructose-bisphosphatase [Rapidithrix thailandica]|uniref:Fructose-1,6-bisphosphatase class 1 n=1 Tax=Rapidithrix thailandica TaxID=413964 RepID=A0AAW9S8U9_9BACT